MDYYGCIPKTTRVVEGLMQPIVVVVLYQVWGELYAEEEREKET